MQKVMNFIDKHSMLKKGDKVIVALSGGPDSICLIHMLDNLKDIYEISLYAAHVNHCLRGVEAEKDEEYVEEFCKDLGIECFTKKIDINAMAKELNMSSETAGREARYQFFSELKERLGASKVALAHNLNDQAETVLMRIIRGTGMDGLNGIKPVRDDIYVRPILGLNRVEIESYCEIHNLNPRIDRSNYENIYNRNKIRLELIPYIQENFNKDIISTLNRFSHIVSKDNELLEMLAEEKYKKYTSVQGNTVNITDALTMEHEAIVSRVIRRALREVKGDLKDIEMVHINDAITLFSLGTGKKINLPGGIIAENLYGQLRLYATRIDSMLEVFKDRAVILEKDKFNNNFPLSIFVKEMNVKVSMRLVSTEENIKFREDTFKKYFDYDKIKCDISLRYRRDGDKFTPYGMNGSKKLKDLFIDLKIPKEQRNLVPLVCFDEEIAWIVGCRVSNNYTVTKNTKSILEIKIVKGEN